MAARVGPSQPWEMTWLTRWTYKRRCRAQARLPVRCWEDDAATIPIDTTHRRSMVRSKERAMSRGDSGSRAVCASEDRAPSQHRARPVARNLALYADAPHQIGRFTVIISWPCQIMKLSHKRQLDLRMWVGVAGQCRPYLRALCTAERYVPRDGREIWTSAADAFPRRCLNRHASDRSGHLAARQTRALTATASSTLSSPHEGHEAHEAACTLVTQSMTRPWPADCDG